ncbi:CRISPR-associated endonuclease Cas2 [Actinomyces oris]|uniref:CRISPR-associated endonuclease Cas2 n=1 Tax=Actinomyces oris TaxID=544580 RepID=UPI002116CDA2|nr:CRISPR-associated endonuclease Cas2 [Actinomyces oris]
MHGRSAGRRARSPRSGCCTPPPTSVPASPWTSTRRARLAAALEGWGYRLQESVFQLRLEPAELDEVRRQVTEIIDQADDVIHLYPLCDSCLARSEVHGTSPALDDAGLYRGVW